MDIKFSTVMPNMPMVDKTSVSLRKRTLERVKKLGKLGDTYDDVINRALDAYERELSKVKSKQKTQ